MDNVYVKRGIKIVKYIIVIVVYYAWNVIIIKESVTLIVLRILN